MSGGNRFKISIDLMLIHSSLFLIGIVLASVFIYFSPIELKGAFFEKFETYYEFSGIVDSVFLFLKECLWICLIAFVCRLPYGRIINILILFYKGFGVGVVSSIACCQMGAGGLKYIFFLILPTNLFYVLSLCVASQIAIEIESPKNGRHLKGVVINKTFYLVCFILTSLGALLESYYVPWMYKIIF